MKEKRQDLNKASQLIAAVLDNELTAEAALAQWPEVDERSSKVLQGAYHFMHHYLSDDDIRERDAKYGMAQRKALQEFMDELSAEAAKL